VVASAGTRAAVTSDADDRVATTQPAVPDPVDRTRTSEPELDIAAPVASGRATPHRDHGRYRILGEHGRGGLGRVSRAHDLDLGRDVAIKELISRGPAHEVRFLREALITARLEHPGIVPVHEAGRWPDGTPFYAMKLVAGRSLRDLLLERKTVEERIGLLHHVIAVADAIAYAHGRNIIHRDLKPANVIVGEFGETVVIDWGLAKDLTAPESSSAGDGGSSQPPRYDDLTSTGSVLGTPAYMSPEQARGEPVDPCTDVFAIGVMLWELCTLQKLSPGDGDPRGRILRRSGIDQDLITIIEKATASDPAQRYADAGALTADLKAFKAGARIAARSYSLLGMLAHWTRRHRALAGSAAAALLVAAAIVVLYVRSIAAERDRTSGALLRAEAAKNDLVLEHAALLLHSDPTAALAALEGYRGAGMSRRTASPPEAARHERATQIAADALGRGAATYTLSPGIGTIASLAWASADRVLIHGTDDKLVEWQLGHDAPERELALAASSRSSTDARRRWFAYQGGDAVVRLRDLQTGSEIDLERLAGTTWALAVSPAGHHVAAAASTGDIVVWDGSARRLRTHSRPPGVYQALRFSPDSSLLAACGRDGRLAVWSVGTGDETAEGKCDGLANTDYEFARDGKTLVAGYRSGMIDQLRLLDRRTAADDKRSIAIAHGAITQIVPGPNTSVFVGTDTGELVLYDVSSAQVVWRSQLASGVVRATYHDQYNLLFAGCNDGRIAMITGSGRSVGALQGHTSRVSAISLSGDSRWLASGSADGTVRIWSLPVPAVQSVQVASAPVFSTRFSPDGELVAAEAQDGTVTICATRTLECTTTVAHASLASGLAWSHDGAALASTGWDGRLRVWNRTSNKSEYFRLSAENGAVHLHGYLTGDRSALLYFQGKRWEVRAIGGQPSPPSVVFESKSSVSLSADGGRLAVATPAGALSVWDTSHAAPQMMSTAMLGHAERLAPDVTLSPSGRLAVVQFASGVSYLVAISDRGDAALTAVPNLGAGAPWLASFSPDEHDVGIGYSDGRIVTIRTATGAQTSYQPFATAAAGLWLGSIHLVGLTREGYVWIYDRASGAQCVTHIERDSVRGASLSPDENTLAIAGESGHLHFYRIPSCRWAKPI
jgi:eukaryotic-like serine/threonine-protein kinase